MQARGPVKAMVMVAMLCFAPAAWSQNCPVPYSTQCGAWEYGDTSWGWSDHDDYQGCLNTAEGAEEYWILTLNECSEVDLWVMPEGFFFSWDPVLLLLPETDGGGDCDPNGCIAGVDNGAEGGSESLTVDLAPGTYYIVVDGWWPGDEGGYDLTVDCYAYTCSDTDGDGYDGVSCPCGDDCDDADLNVHPGAPDANCDWVDNDCDGQTDEDAATGADPLNCGACGNICDFDHAQVSCQAGTCVMGACDAGWVDCNASDADGCEATLGSDQHCAACGDTCTYAHASGSCQAGSCLMGACDAGFGDCNANALDGCETGLGTDAHCANCNDVCGQDESCLASQCQANCSDGDSDGYLDQACGGPDCNDANPSIHPGAAETCGDGIDQDCNGQDQACQCADADGDGHTAQACGGDDCDDANFDVHPGAVDSCGDGVDQDCSGADLPCACADADGDTYQDLACGGTDCNDANASVHPDANDICGDGIDQDCSGADLPCDCTDADGDGHPDTTCGGSDCNDADASVHPGAVDICGDGIDQDCSGADLPCDCVDADGDGHTDQACGGDDCEDGSRYIYPGAQEICGDGIDQDCDGQDLPCNCIDADQDGYADHLCGGLDCNDAAARIHPNALDDCDDGIDQNCDGHDRKCGQTGCACATTTPAATSVLLAALTLLALFRRRDPR